MNEQRNVSKGAKSIKLSASVDFFTDGFGDNRVAVAEVSVDRVSHSRVLRRRLVDGQNPCLNRV